MSSVEPFPNLTRSSQGKVSPLKVSLNGSHPGSDEYSIRAMAYDFSVCRTLHVFSAFTFICFEMYDERPSPYV